MNPLLQIEGYIISEDDFHNLFTETVPDSDFIEPRRLLTRMETKLIMKLMKWANGGTVLTNEQSSTKESTQ